MWKLTIQIFQAAFSSWTFSVMSDFLTWSMLSCFTRTLMIYWLLVSLDSSSGLFYLLNPNFSIPDLKEWIQYISTTFCWMTKISTQSCSHYSGKNALRFEKRTGHIGPEGFDALCKKIYLKGLITKCFR